MTPEDPLWQALRPGVVVTIVKSHYVPDRPDYEYPARVIESDRPGWLAFEAEWALPDMDVDGIRYETGGTLIEYFSPQKRFNIFHVYRRTGESSGLYANVSEYPTITASDATGMMLTWVDCWLDVIRLPNGEVRLLDEDELVASGIEKRDPRLGIEIRKAADIVVELLRSDEWTL